MTTETGTRYGRRNDPDRRDRIVAACLDVIAESGIAGTSHRRIAEAAKVPLGSMTYYFTGIDELLHEALTCFASEISERFEQRMTSATDAESAREAVIEIILGDVFRSTRELVISHEIYTLAARDPGYRVITTEWMKRSRTALERHFDPETARIVDALIEGLSIHRSLDDHPWEATEVVRAVTRVLTSAQPTVAASLVNTRTIRKADDD